MLVFWLIAITLIILYLTWIGVLYYGWLRPGFSGSLLSPGQRKAFVSIIIPVRNEELNISYLLNDLLKQDYPRKLFEIIIIDDHSTDLTPDLVAHFTRCHDHIRYIKLDGEESGKKTAVHKGVLATRFPLVLTTDADCRPVSGWVKTMVDFFEHTRADLVAGPVLLQGGNGFFSKFQQLEFLSLVGASAGAINSGNPVMCNAANLGFSKKAYLEARNPYFDKFPSGDDVFLLLAMHKTGHGRIFFIKTMDACVFTAAEPDLNGFLRQRKRWASKGRHLNTKSSVFTALLVFLINLYALTCFLSGFFMPSLFLVAGAIFLFKSAIDIPFLNSVTGFFGKRRLMWYFPAIQFLYFFYISFTAISAFTGFYNWKGRVVRF
jgi:cellulose synthase/poly-beta-1,6-N-acetylglucosamine synthase-like glycosyltransferase